MDWIALLGWVKSNYGYLGNVKEAYDSLQNLLSKSETSVERKLQEGFEQLRKNLQETRQDLSNLILSAEVRRARGRHVPDVRPNGAAHRKGRQKRPKKPFFYEFLQSCTRPYPNVSSVCLTRALEVRLQYVGCEDEIWWATDCFVTYLHDRDSQYKKDKFVERGETLRNAVRTLMEGLLGQRSLRTDLLAAIVELEEKRPGRIRKRIGPFVELVNAGILLHAAYVQVSKIPDADYKDTFDSLYVPMTARIDGEIARWAKEDEVPIKMIDIMNSFPHFGDMNYLVVDVERERLAEKIHRELSDRYDSRQWLVIVFGTDCFLEPGSPGWHCSSSVKGRYAFAKSFPFDYQDRPAPFKVSSQMPRRALNWSEWIFYPLTSDYELELSTGAMDELARQLSRSQPGNTYLVLQKNYVRIAVGQGGGVAKGILAVANPVLKPSGSSLVREVQVGNHYKVIACPR